MNTMTDHKDLRLIAEEYIQLSNAHDLDGLINLHNPAYVSYEANGVLSNLEDYKKFVASFFEAFPDAQLHLVHAVVDGDILVMHFTTTGTQTKPFMGLPASGKSVNFTEIRVRRIADGKIVEHWGLFDMQTFLGQLQ